ncbi:MAG TPA: ABC transporter substrate-binding protein [Hyphomicrobiales bacterium]|nr:ABC transporter substrate-binding protein [Hyphomicrobiales bacterium]
MKISHVLAAATLAVAISGFAGAAKAEKDVVVAVQVPLSGPISVPRGRIGAEVARDQINKQGLLGEGRTLKLLIEDNGGDKTQAISLANQAIVADKVVALVAGAGSALSVPVAPVANTLKTPVVAVGSSPAIVDAGPWGFCTFFASEEQVDVTAQLIDRLKVHAIAIIYDRSNDGSVRMKDSLQEQLKKQGVSVVSTDGIAPSDTNFGPLATRIAGEKIDAIYIEGAAAVAANFLIQVRQAGVGPNVRFLGAPQMYSPVLTQIGGKAIEGLYLPASYQIGLATDLNKEFVKEFRARGNTDPDIVGAAYYTAVMLIARAVHDAGPNADRQSVRDALDKIRNMPSVLGQGTFSFDKRRFGVFKNVLVRVEGGKFVPVSD